MKTKIPPPILLAIAGAIMWLTSRSAIAYPVWIPYALPISGALALLGVLVDVLALRQFRVAQTTVNPLKPEKATALVQTGIFGRSRNPMYVGLVFILLGWAVWLGSVSNFVVIGLFVLVITELQIKPEERALKGLFGDAYEGYCRKVRRWF